MSSTAILSSAIVVFSFVSSVSHFQHARMTRWPTPWSARLGCYTIIWDTTSGSSSEAAGHRSVPSAAAPPWSRSRPPRPPRHGSRRLPPAAASQVVGRSSRADQGSLVQSASLALRGISPTPDCSPRMSRCSLETDDCLPGNASVYVRHRALRWHEDAAIRSEGGLLLSRAERAWKRPPPIGVEASRSCSGRYGVGSA